MLEGAEGSLTATPTIRSDWDLWDYRWKWPPLEKVREPATQTEIEEIIEAYGIAAEAAQRIGSRWPEVHGAHGYLIDQFLWDKTNIRDDRYGGGGGRTQPVWRDVIREIIAEFVPTSQ